jgi:hypothetical protein
MLLTFYGVKTSGLKFRGSFLLESCPSDPLIMGNAWMNAQDLFPHVCFFAD